jgi:hypothetical protein
LKYLILLLLKEEELRMEAQRKTRRVDRQKCAVEEQVSGRVLKGSRQIVIPMTREQYDEIWTDPVQVRAVVTDLLAESPELFPADMQNGFSLEGFARTSRKLDGIRLRKVLIGDSSYWLRPSFVMPYMTGVVEDLEYPLLLASFGVPAWLLTKGFGHSDMYWYRMIERLGRNSLVGTTVRRPECLPEHIAADEHHADWCGEKGYLASTAGNGCLLGVALTSMADDEHLRQAYSDFAAEARDVKSDYSPATVNTDGWPATQNAFQALFPVVSVILCFLHGFLKVRDRCRKNFDLHTRIWDIYRAATVAEFNQRMTEFREWCSTQTWSAAVHEMVAKLWKRAPEYATAYAHPGCLRTSNTIDRPMNRLCRLLYAGRGLHGHRKTSEQRLRGWALLLNFRPFAPRSGLKREYQSPAHRLNQARYHDHWLHNLMTSTSLMGFRKSPPAIR